MKKLLLFLCVAIVSYHVSYSSESMDLKRQIENVLANKNATVGVAVMNMKTKDILTVNNDYNYPMMSVYKFHLALAVLSEVDQRKLSLDQKIWVAKADLLPDTHSPLRDKNPEGEIYVTLKELLSYTVSQSDNNACDILFRIVGGTEPVDNYIKQLGINDVSIRYTEVQMHENWENQYTNTSTPMAAVQLLDLFYNQNIVSNESTGFLWQIMKETSTGMNKIKGQLPENTVVGHKTGSSFSNDAGLKAAENDIGIITLPNGNSIAIAIFVTNSMESDETNAQIISTISKTVWDYYKIS